MVPYLQQNPHEHSHHDEPIDGAENLSHEKLNFSVHDEANEHVADDWDQVVQECVVVGDAEGHGEGSDQHQENCSGTEHRADHHHDLGETRLIITLRAK